MPLILLKLWIVTYFDMLNTNMTMKIGGDNIFKVKRTKTLNFQQFSMIIMNTNYPSEKNIQINLKIFLIHLSYSMYFFSAKTQTNPKHTILYKTKEFRLPRTVPSCEARLLRSGGIPYIFKACEKKSLGGICLSVWHHWC